MRQKHILVDGRNTWVVCEWRFKVTNIIYLTDSLLITPLLLLMTLDTFLRLHTIQLSPFHGSNIHQLLLISGIWYLVGIQAIKNDHVMPFFICNTFKVSLLRCVSLTGMELMHCKPWIIDIPSMKHPSGVCN